MGQIIMIITITKKTSKKSTAVWFYISFNFLTTIKAGIIISISQTCKPTFTEVKHFASNYTTGKCQNLEYVISSLLQHVTISEVWDGKKLLRGEKGVNWECPLFLKPENTLSALTVWCTC